MSGLADCQVIGRWRIVGSDTWDRDYLDLVEPAFINIDPGGRGELAFGVVNAFLNLEYSQTVVFFTFEGSDEGDEVSGSVSAELQEEGTLEIKIAFHLGDDAILNAKRVGSSTPCLALCPKVMRSASKIPPHLLSNQTHVGTIGRKSVTYGKRFWAL